MAKDLNIFSMSALDLFASAMGAFILLSVILFPYYLKDQGPAPDCPEPRACEPAPTCEDCPPPSQEIMDKLLLVSVIWDVPGDVDLHIQTPDGEYSYQSRWFASQPGAIMVIDDTCGGQRQKIVYPDGRTACQPVQRNSATPPVRALESWKSFEPTAGSYRLCANNFNIRTVIDVDIALDKPSGPVRVNGARLVPGQKTCFISFDVTSNFEVVSLRTAREGL